MKVSSYTHFFIFLFILTLTSCCTNKNDETISSPDQTIRVQFEVSDSGDASYSVFLKDEQLINNSVLGLVTDSEDFSTDLNLIKTSIAKEINESYSMLIGKKTHREYAATEKTFFLKNSKNKAINITFRVSDDGIAFRYAFPEEDGIRYTITEEKTSFHFFKETKAWLQPMAEVNTGWAATNPSYEEHYLQDIPVGSPCPTKAGWVYPALFNYKDTWLLISETGIEKSHCATRLDPNSSDGNYKIAFPMEEEVYTDRGLLSTSTLPWALPWRFICIGDQLGDIVESTLGTDLAPANRIEDISWIKPGHASWSWIKYKDESIVYDVQKRYVDFASNMNWEYCLVDVNWDRNIGYDKMEELATYAKSKNVGLILWYNSSGKWNTTEYTPKGQLLTREQRQKEFARLEKMGIKGIKVDFFAGDGQSMMEYYIELFEDAAQYHLLVNCHGATLPRGWHRTYPHLVTMESIKGFEFITFSQVDADKQANHCCMTPYTRNAFDPMDFTPMSFSEIPGLKRTTSNAFELALPVIMLSGVQHFAESDIGMASVPDYIQNILKDFPTSWEDTRFLDGYPGKLAVIARKSGTKWYVGGINGENISKDLEINISSLGSLLDGMLIEDGKTSRSFKKSVFTPNEDKLLKVSVLGNGGFVAILSMDEITK